MTDLRGKYVEKVRKLLAKAQATDVQAEADTFFAKAAELITQWRIEEAELVTVNDDTPVKITHNLGTYTPKADCIALSMIVKSLGVKVAFTPYGGSGYPPRAHLYGYPGDVEKAELLWAAVSLQLAGACRVAEPYGLDRSAIRVFRQSFKLGYAQRVGERLRQARAVAMDTARAAGGSGGGLVLAREGEVERYMKDQGTRPGRAARMQVNGQANAAGYRAGGNADLGQTGLGGRTKGALT